MSDEKDTNNCDVCVVFAEGRKSYVIDGHEEAENEEYVGKALPFLLENGWSISREVSAGPGAYFIMKRSYSYDPDPLEAYRGAMPPNFAAEAASKDPDRTPEGQ